jgi:hypothetical protein
MGIDDDDSASGQSNLPSDGKTDDARPNDDDVVVGHDIILGARRAGS